MATAWRYRTRPIATRTQPNTASAGTSHTHASALLLSGAREHVLMRRLGHADIQTTLNLYGWVTEDAELRALADWRGFCVGVARLGRRHR